jgi:hypothetical protein
LVVVRVCGGARLPLPAQGLPPPGHRAAAGWLAGQRACSAHAAGGPCAPGVVARGDAGEHKHAGADDAANAQHDEVNGAQDALHLRAAGAPVLGLLLDGPDGERLLPEQLEQLPRPAAAVLRGVLVCLVADGRCHQVRVDHRVCM